jgi:outer membrane protein TolC
MVVLASCHVTKPYRQPETAVEGLYRGVKAVDTTNIAHLSWREIFTDTVLQGLINKGINNNLDLKIAVTRIQSAEANLRQSKLALWPSLSVSPSFTLSKTSSAQLRSFNIQGSEPGGGSSATVIPTVKQYSLTASTSWEADVWGKLRSTKRAYLASFLQSEAYKRSVQTQLVADIATNYFALLAYDQQLRITKETIEIRRSDVQTMKELKQAAIVTGADVVQSESNLYAAEVTLPDIKQNIRETENALSVLLAIPPDSIPRTRLDEQLRDGSLQTGLPAQLLANRPDVQQAEYSFGMHLN